MCKDEYSFSLIRHSVNTVISSQLPYLWVVKCSFTWDLFWFRHHHSLFYIVFLFILKENIEKETSGLKESLKGVREKVSEVRQIPRKDIF